MSEKKNENEVVTGLVRWFSNERGYGFLQKDGESGDESVEYFIHFSNIQMEGYKTLKAGQKVTFELINTDKGIQATNVTPA